MKLLFICLAISYATAQTCTGSTGPCKPGDICNTNETCITDNTGKECCPKGSIVYPSTVTPTTCKDKLNPKSGTSDCPADVQLCTDPIYKDVMKDQCPKTCGFCSTNSPSSSTCQDLTNPATGTSDCSEKKYLCQAPGYVDFMKVQCPKTCGYCS